MEIDSHVLYEDNHLLVVNKPPLIATMGAAAGETSLADLAKDYLRRKYQKPGNVYLGIVSRLDKFVSGVIVFARTSKAASRLSEQFRLKQTTKVYWAIVPDNGQLESGRLEHFVYKNDSKKRMIATVDPATIESQNAKQALLRFRALGFGQDQAMLEIMLETGRKHQIRVQFSSFGVPIVGDRKYGSQLEFPKGIALHSRSLKIEHPTQKVPMTFEVLPPICWKTARFGI